MHLFTSFNVYNFCRIALEQASRRGWFTYTDLTAIWDATDLQYSMMLATKQTAKVGGVDDETSILWGPTDPLGSARPIILCRWDPLMRGERFDGIDFLVQSCLFSLSCWIYQLLYCQETE